MKTDSKATRFLRQKQQIPDFGKGSLCFLVFTQKPIFFLSGIYFTVLILHESYCFSNIFYHGYLSFAKHIRE